MLIPLKKIQAKIDDTANEKAIVRTASNFSKWCTSRGVPNPFPACVETLSAYVVSRCTELSGSAKSLMVWFRQLRTYSMMNRLEWILESEERTVTKIIRHLEVEDLAPTRRVSPMLQELLASIFAATSVPNLTKLVCAIGHDGLLRGGEICSGLLVSDHSWSASRSSVTIELKRTKVHRRGGSQFVTLHDYGPLSAVRRLRAHFDRYKLWNRPASLVYPAFVRGRLDWSRSLSTPQLRSMIKVAIKAIGLDPTKFANHSLRAGGATDLFRCGVYYPTIKKFGRWSTDCALIYYRDDEGVSNAVFDGFAKLSQLNSRV